jgi:curli biogenesis system outer membrane secretion channel CsgG
MSTVRALIAAVTFCVALFQSGEAPAQIQYVTVQAEGTGRSIGHAVGMALKEAVTQVNGTQVAATTVSVEIAASLETETESKFANAAASAEAIATKTKGAIKEYRIVNKAKEGNVWTVTVEAAIAKYAAGPQVNRLRMAVVPFRLKNNAQAAFRDRFVQDLTTQLTQSRKFAMLDRQFGAERQRELDMLTTGSTPPGEMARLGNTLGTDYLIVGVIEDASQAVRTFTMQSANKTFTQTTANVRLSYRIIDAATGQIKHADGFARSVEEGSVEALGRSAADEISRQILETIFPLMVESVSSDVLYVGQGGKSLRLGERFRIVRYGKEIKDSYTKESLGREETDVGIAEIIDVQAKLAKAKIVKQSVDVAKEFAPASFILRPLKPGTGVQAAAAPARPATQQAGRPQAPAAPAPDLKRKMEGNW